MTTKLRAEMTHYKHYKETLVWCYYTRALDTGNKFREEFRETRDCFPPVDAGYCLDAVENSPAGGMFGKHYSTMSFGGSMHAYDRG